jgi:tetratricopeptide (TPR) repeat protein
MKCNIKYKYISLYLDGVYRGKKREALKAHFAECPLCKKSLEQAESLKASLSNLSEIKESPGFDFEFNRILDDKIAQQESHGLARAIRGKVSGVLDRIIIPIPATVKIAASLILMLSVFIGIRSHVMDKLPFVEFSAGNVKIYRQSVNAWVASKPNLRLMQGDKIELKDGAVINIVSKSKFRARIKDDSLIVLSKLNSGINSLDADFSVSHGKLLVNTAESFKGSSMRIYTPACDAEVIGTAFMVDVSENNTWIGVLEGTVKLLSKPHPLKVDTQRVTETFVLAGQKAHTKQYYEATVPELLSSGEWQSMLELYQLVEDPEIMLLIGTGVDRVNDLLGRPALVYIPDSIKRIIPRKLLESIYDVAASTESGDLAAVSKKARSLLEMLSQYPSPRYEVDILMFIASHFHYAKDYRSALQVLDQVALNYPESEMASLAWSGMASIYKNDLKDTRKADKIYADLIKSYPNSSEAIMAKEILSAQR